MTIEPTFRERAMRFVLREYEITLDELLAGGRRQVLSDARALFVWIVRTYRPATSYPTLAGWLGLRNHTSAIEAHTRAVRMRLDEGAFADACERFVAHYRTTGALDACH